VFILAILVFFIGGALTLFAFRGAALAPGGLFHPISREGALVLNNLLLTTAAATVLVGTLYPLLIEALTGDKISVGAPVFTPTFVPLCLPLLAAVPFGPMLSGKRGELLGAAQRLQAAFPTAAAGGRAAYFITDRASAFAALGMVLGFWLILGALTDLAPKRGIGKAASSVALRRLIGLPLSVFGTALAHAGLGLTVLGIVGVTALEKEQI